MNEKEEALNNYFITGAGVIDRETFIFVAQGDENVTTEDGKKWWGENKRPSSRIIVHNTHKNTWGWLGYSNSGFLGGLGAIAGGYIDGQKRALVVNHMSQVAYFEFANGVNQSEQEISGKIILSTRSPCLIGAHFYVAGADRRIAKRLEPEKWIFFSPEPDLDVDAESFRAIDGFSETDIYVCGGAYNLWHFDGETWTLMNAPIEWWMRCICCADDGLVYIGGMGGEILVGNREQGWEVVVDSMERGVGDINFIARYQGRVYAMTDNYLWELVDGKLVGARFSGDIIPNSFGHLSVNDGVMLVAGAYGAAVYDGQSWTHLIGGVAAENLLKVQLMEKQVKNLEKVRDAAYGIDAALKQDGHQS